MDGIIIAGPTACGKSAASVSIAKSLSVPIINADSRQVYSGLPLLTAQPSIPDREKVAHHLYEEYPYDYSGMSSVKWALIVNNILENSRAVIAGGTGFYINTLVNGSLKIPAFERSVLKETTEELYARLRETDPESADSIKSGDRYRIERSLNIFDATGIRMSEWQKHPLQKPSKKFYKILLLPDKTELKNKISERFLNMIDMGAIEEVSKFVSLPGYEKSPLYSSCGLREIESYINGDTSLDEAISLSIIKTCQYARRQITWFRNKFQYDFIARDKHEVAEHSVNLLR